MGHLGDAGGPGDVRRYRRRPWRAATVTSGLLVAGAVTLTVLAAAPSRGVPLYPVLFAAFLLGLAGTVLALDSRLPTTVTADRGTLTFGYLRATRTEDWERVLRVRGSGLGGEDEHVELVDGRLVALPPGMPSGTVDSWRAQLEAPPPAVPPDPPPVWRVPPERGAPLVLLLSLPATVYVLTGMVADHSVPALLLTLAVVGVVAAWALRLRAGGAQWRADPAGLTFSGRRRRMTVPWADLAGIRDLHRFEPRQVLVRADGTTATLPPGLPRDVVLGWQARLAPDQPVGAGVVRSRERRHRAPRRRWPAVLAGLIGLLGLYLLYLAVFVSDGDRHSRYFLVLALLGVAGAIAWWPWWLTHEPREAIATPDGLTVRYRRGRRPLPWQQVRRVRGMTGFEGRDLHVELVDGDLVKLPVGVAGGTVERWRAELGGAAPDVRRGAPQVWRVPYEQSTPATWGWLVPHVVYQVSGPVLGYSVPALLGGVLLVVVVAVVPRRRAPEAIIATTEGLSFRRPWRTEVVRWSDYAGVTATDRWDDTPVVRRTDGSHVQLTGGLTKEVVEQWHYELGRPRAGGPPAAGPAASGGADALPDDGRQASTPLSRRGRQPPPPR